ncbi:MAG: hypothetical protein RLY20_1972 [Verrucomicrobiota bacterium]|jgi:prepilin-type processing-associated H-X9-DG protein
MYKIRGGDGKEYGPVSAETLRAWVAQGRANAQTYVLIEGGSQWQPMAVLAEFADLFAARPAMGAGGFASATPPRTSGMAIASLVLGCLGLFFCGLTSLVGLPLGLVAMSKIKKSQGELGGWGLALGGTIISGVSLLFIPLFIAMFIPVLSKAKSKAVQINCVNNLRQAGLAIRIYSGDNEDKLPLAAKWCDAITNEMGSEKVYVCPQVPALRSGYAFNAKLSGLAEGDIDPQTVMLFEADTGWNASGGKELMISKPRHNNRWVVCFADGSVQQMTAAQVAKLKWDPKPSSNNE